jgi:hypothetical protein
MDRHEILLIRGHPKFIYWDVLGFAIFTVPHYSVQAHLYHRSELDVLLEKRLKIP